MTRKVVPWMVVAFFFTLLALPHLIAQTPQGEKNAPRRLRAGRILEKALELSDGQKARLEELRQAWKTETESYRKNRQAKNRELRDLRKDPDENEAKIEALRDSLFEMQIDRMRKSYAHRKEVSKIYTPEQKKMLNRFSRMRRLMRGMQNRGRSIIRGRRSGFFGWRGTRRAPDCRGPIKDQI